MTKKKIHPSALRIAIVFLVIGALWIILSDKIVAFMVRDVNQLTAIQTIKGWVFIAITAIVIFMLVNHEISKKEKLITTISEKSHWQRLLLSNLPQIQVFLLTRQFEPIFFASDNPNSILKTLLEVELKSQDTFCKKGSDPSTLYNLLKTAPENFKIELALELDDDFLEIHYIPVLDKNNAAPTFLLIVFNKTQERELIRQVTSERKSFSRLSGKYHALNRELGDSYKQLQTYNKELIENKERYSAFIQQTSEAVYRIDMKKPVDLSLSMDIKVAAVISTCYLAEYNTAFANIYNLGIDKAHVGKGHYDIYPEANHVQSQVLIRELVEHNFTLKDHESVEYDANGRTRYFLNNIVGIVEDNKLIRFWGTKLETTKQKKHERELIHAKKLAEESNKLKSAFLANMSHEIRTPLNGILGFSELICNTGLSDTKRERYFDIIQSSNQQLLRIINDILDVSRLQTGQILIEKATFPLNTLINEIETSMQLEIQQKKKEIDFVTKRGLKDGEDEIKSDRDRLFQVITNLVNNAIKFTDKGSVKLSYEKKSKSFMEFSVADTGIGIPDKYLESIFDQFRQVEEFASRKYGGTGLGLSISKGMVELLGGYIAVESEECGGSTFKFPIKIK
ncbi:MAG TPA: hypothetical protein DDX98_03870 [Bacteroidales bacterium]|nr:hypothetical protein [Bacteroidales bacterium]